MNSMDSVFELIEPFEAIILPVKEIGPLHSHVVLFCQFFIQLRTTTLCKTETLV